MIFEFWICCNFDINLVIDFISHFIQFDENVFIEHTVNWFTWCCSDNITNNMFVVMHGKSTQFKRIGNNRKVEYRFVVVNWSVKLRVSYFWMKCLDTASRKVIAGWLLGIENKRMGLYVRGNFHTSIQAVSSYVASEPVS